MQSGGLCRIAHVEAGLRSNDWGMPEEVNRVLTDRLSDALLSPSRDAEANLHREGITSGISFVGNVMIDSLLRMLPAARASGALERLSLKPRGYLLATLHRPSNVDDAGQLGTILDAFAVLSRELQVLLPLHPRTRDRARAFGFEDRLERLTVTDPLPYIEMLGVQAAAAAILTDSGGVQEESTVLGVPCVTLRESTERPVTVTEGTNQLAPWPLSSAGIVRAAHDALSRGVVAVGSRAPELWDGQSGSRVVEALER
jgi:UDP-N-acetylglucosamine 2-epimerase (non-hydrolysing)